MDSRGLPSEQTHLGVPFYYRGWTGVPAGSNHGLYQTATGPSAAQTDSGDVPGIAMYKEIEGIVEQLRRHLLGPRHRFGVLL
jgi:chitinase